MKNCLFFLLMFFIAETEALSNYAEVYPPLMQTLVCTYSCLGDRHGDFKDDFVAVLTDGSAWKVHPESASLYQTWKLGDLLHIRVRKDKFWFKREHHFLLYNHTRDESVKVMLIQQKSYPIQIIATESYHKSQKPIYDKNQTVTGYLPTDLRKILYLSDGSVWVIKNHFNDFQIGMNVYIGAQGHPKAYYDFVLITGDEREAKWTFARPHAI